MGDEAQIQELLAALDSDDLQTRLNAIVKLGELKSVEAIPKLIELLNDKSQDSTLRMTILSVLGDIGHISALRAVMNIAREEEPPISVVAQIASEQILNTTVEPEPAESSAPPAPAGDLLPEEDKIDYELEDTGAMQPIDLDDMPPAPAGPTFTGGAKPIERDQLLEEFDEQDSKIAEDEARGEIPSAEVPAQPLPAPGGLPVPRPQPLEPPKRSETETSRRREEANPQQPVQFSAYYPREVRPDEWQPLQAYIFKESAADRILEDAEKQLGPLDRFRRIVENARQIIREGETITATPNLPGFQFNPPSAAISFFEDWHRFDFKMRAKDAPLNLAANGFLTFTVNGIIVADIPLSVFVTNEVTNSQPQRTAPQPIYDTVFASYSHQDTPVVLRVEAAAKAFGMTYLRDVISLRSGENWSAGLEKMIEDATIFQMFWSHPYSISEHCRHEWEYAVSINKPIPHFIRPVYWLQPMPAPPQPLQHLHFTYQPDLIK